MNIKKYKRFVAVGCSITKDNYQKTWPDYLSLTMKIPMINVGARGAGLDFLSKRLLTFELQKNDLVGIMLPSADRFDWYIDADSPLWYDGLKISSWQNGKSSSLLDLQGIEHQDHGFSLSGGNYRGYKKFWYKYFYSQYKAELDYWANVILIQNFLKNKKIDYFFTSVYDKDFFIENEKNKTKDNYAHKIVNHVDFNKFIFYKDNQGFFSFCKDNNYTFDRNHPVTEAHEQYAKYLYQELEKIS